MIGEPGGARPRPTDMRPAHPQPARARTVAGARTLAGAIGLILSLGLVLCACGSQPGSQPTNQPGGPAYDPAGTPTATATDAPTPTQPPTPGADVTLSGRVVQGAEPSCLILRTTHGDFELMTDAQQARAGDQVVAVGHVVHVNSHCMQGTPFQVTRLTVK